MQRHLGLTLLAVSFLAAAPAAQRLVKADRLDLGIKLRVFKFLKETTLPPIERQIGVKWIGKSEVVLEEVEPSGRKRKRKMAIDLTLFAFTVDKTKKRRVGPSKLDRLNGAVDLQDFLIRREVIDQKDPRLYKVEYKKPLKNKSRAIWKVTQVIRKSQILARIYYVESKTEVFGLVATTKTTLKPFAEGLDKIARSVQRVTAVAAAATNGGDPYADSKLPNLKRRREVVAKLPKGWQHRDTKNFLVITAIKKSKKNDKLVDAIANDLELMRTEFEKRFPPLKPLTRLAVVRIFDDYNDYMAYGAPKGTGGYWSPTQEELVLPNPGKRVKKPLSYRKGNAMAVLYHEAMHQYLHYANGQPSPASWFNEGYGEYFGGAQVDRRRNVIKKITYNDWRWKMVKLQVKNDAYPPLKNMLRMTQDEFYSRFALKNYAFSWAFCYFLEQERARPKGSRNEQWAAIPENYLKNLRQTRSHKGAYEKTFEGLDMKKLQDDWFKAMKKWK